MLEQQKRYIIDFNDIPAERARMPELPAQDRIAHFEEIEKGFSPEQARREAERCLSCRRCLGCKLCLAACEREAIDFDQQDEEYEVLVNEIILTPGVMRTPDTFDERFGYRTFLNVVSDLEFERMLHPDGPYGGLILRPFDGEVPKKIGFISPEEKSFNPYSLAILIKEAAVARRKIKGCERWLFSHHPWEEYEYLKPLREHLSDLIIKTGSIIAITQPDDTGDLTVEFQDGEEKRRETFEMVILSSRIQLPAEAKRIADQLGLKLGPTIDPIEDPAPRETPQAGIVVAGGITLSTERG